MSSTVWRVVASSVRGTRHEDRGLPCQDANLARVLQAGELLVAIADGAGSAPRAEEGAQQAVKEAMASLERDCERPLPPDEDALKQVLIRAFTNARSSLVQLAETEDCPLESFETTLMCLVVNDDLTAVGQIGDGVTLAQRLDGSLFTAALPQRGEYANEAFMLTMPGALDHLDIAVHWGKVRSLAVSTDGLLRLAVQLPSYEPHLPFFQPLLSFVEDAADEEQAQETLAAFLTSERVCARTDDDKTLVVALRLGGDGEPHKLQQSPRRRKRRARKKRQV